MPNQGNFVKYILIFIAIIFFLSISKIISLYTDYFWFSSLGFSSIFTTILTSKILLFLGAALAFFIFAGINLWVASMLQKSRWQFKIVILAILGLSFFQGLVASKFSTSDVIISWPPALMPSTTSVLSSARLV